MEKEIKKKSAIIFITALIFGVLIYGSSILDVIIAVLHRQGSSHGIFVPFLSGYFIWINRQKIKASDIRYDFFGVILIFIGLFMGLADAGGFQIKFIGFISFISGLIQLFLGRQLLKILSFPLFFIITMVPLPSEAFLYLANFVRDITLEGSIIITQLTGITFLREGIMVQLPNALLKVNLGCSGIRYLFSFFVFGMAYAYLYRKSFFSRLSIIALTIPISLFASILRLTSIFLLTYFFGSRMAEHWPHIFISWTIFLIVMIFFLLSDQVFWTGKEKLRLKT